MSSRMEAVVEEVPYGRSGEPVSASGDGEASEQPDLSLKGLVLLAQFHGVAANAEQLRHDAGKERVGFDPESLLLAARRLGLKSRLVKQPIERLDRVALPALALGEDGDAFIVARFSAEKILIHDLELERPITLTAEQFQSRYKGRLLVVASRASEPPRVLRRLFGLSQAAMA